MPLNLDELKEVNEFVNSRVIFTPDFEQWNQEDRWEDALETGKEDCDGYAIAKMRKLLALDWPREQLKLGLCNVETGEYHCVLVVTFDGEDWVLDNRYAEPMQWELMPYTWDRFYLLGERKWRKFKQ
jgi:predicted transglutaminase-like cysteine proteinase